MHGNKKSNTSPKQKKRQKYPAKVHVRLLSVRQRIYVKFLLIKMKHLKTKTVNCVFVALINILIYKIIPVTDNN